MATGNIAKNDITGQYIKSRPPSKAWNENYDRIFAKKTPAEWAELDGLEGNYDSVNLVTYREFLNSTKSKDE